MVYTPLSEGSEDFSKKVSAVVLSDTLSICGCEPSSASSIATSILEVWAALHRSVYFSFGSVGVSRKIVSTNVL